jgi:alkaline phosphatase
MKKLKKLAIIALIVSFIGSGICNPKQVTASLQTMSIVPEGEAIKNIIVMIPDGMSPSGVTLARWLRSYNSATGSVDPTVSLALDEIASGMVRNYWVDHHNTVGGMIDSAPAGTAFATGVHTVVDHISVTSGDKTPVATVLEAANALGKATGLVATSNIQHATPAAFSSHTVNRRLNEVIAEQQAYNHIDVILGGGSQFLQDENRQDGEDILASLTARGYQIVNTRDEMMRITEGPLWGMFAPDAMAYDWDKGTTDQPSLAEMTQTAINLLSQDEAGFFLMVEGSKVDWAGHTNDPVGIVSDILAFDDAVGVALDFAKESQNTMLLVMTDHGTGGITIGNHLTDDSYASDPVSLHVSLLSQMTRTPEGIYNQAAVSGEDIIDLIATHMGITDLTSQERLNLKNAISSWNFQEVLGPIISDRIGIGWTTGGHTGEDVPFYSYLPGNRRLTGVFHNIEIAHIIADTWGFNLPELTSEIFVNVNDAVATYITEQYDETLANARMVVEKNGNLLEILENKNYVLFNDEKVAFGSVAVFSNGNFFIPQAIIDRLEIPREEEEVPKIPEITEPEEEAPAPIPDEGVKPDTNLPQTGVQASVAALPIGGLLLVIAWGIKRRYDVNKK